MAELGMREQSTNHNRQTGADVHVCEGGGGTPSCRFYLPFSRNTPTSLPTLKIPHIKLIRFGVWFSCVCGMAGVILRTVDGRGGVPVGLRLQKG